jgi:putative protease
MADKKIGEVIHVFDKIQVAIVKLTAPIKAGATLKFKHGDDEFTQTADSIQIEHKPVTAAKKGDEIGVKVDQPVKKNSQVYLV